MIKEVEDNQAVYQRQLGGPVELEKILSNLRVEDVKEKIKMNKWLSNLDHGQILANTYIRPVSFVSSDPRACQTFLPLRNGPSDSPSTDPIYLVHFGGNHWLLMVLGGAAGVKPIPPYFSAKRFTLNKAQAWKNLLKDGVELYKNGT